MSGVFTAAVEPREASPQKQNESCRGTGLELSDKASCKLLRHTL